MMTRATYKWGMELKVHTKRLSGLVRKVREGFPREVMAEMLSAGQATTN